MEKSEMNPKITIVTLSEAIISKDIRVIPESEWREIAYTAKHKNHKLVLEYSDKFPLKPLYPPHIRACIDGIWVISKKVKDEMNW